MARLWDAFADPIVGVLADRTNTRWGKFRPWVLFSALPWCVVMILAYTTPKGWSMGAMIAYAAITNILLMSIYSMNNMPYSALGGVMTGDINERAKLNSFRFISVNAAQFIVGGLTLPLVAKFAVGHDAQYGWRMVMTIWAVLCFVLFLITFFSTKERIQPPPQQKSDFKQDFAGLIKNGPWIVMFAMTLVHFCILSFRGGALYNYYHHYADKAAMYDWLQKLGLTAPPLAPGAPRPGGILEWLGYIVHADRSNLANSNVADVFNSIINMIGTGVTIIVLLMSPVLSREIRQEGRRGLRFRIGRIGHLRVLSAWPANVNGMVVADDSGSDLLCPDHPADLGHLCGRGGLLRVEDRTPIHGHCFRYHLLCVKNRVGARFVLVPVDYGGIFQLRYQTA